MVDFYDSWEDGTFDKWLTILGNPWAIITDPVKCGEKAIWCTSDTGGIYHALNSSPDIQRFKFHMRIVPNPDEPPAGAGSGVLFQVEFTDNSFIQLYVLTGHLAKPSLFLCTDFGSNYCYGTTELNSNEWYCIEIRIETNKNGATQQLYINDSLECSFVVDLPSRNFYRAYFEAFRWSFLMDCRVAVDCYAYEASDTEIGCECTACGHPPTHNITIENAGGSLNVSILGLSESQDCNPFIGDIPTRSAGQYINTGVWVLKIRTLRIRVRLSDAEKTTLLAIFNQLANVTITAIAGTNKTWTYYGWFRKKKIVYKYAKGVAVTPWRCDLVFDIYSFNYVEV